MTYLALIISQSMAFAAFYLFISSKKIGKKTFIALCFTLTIFSLLNLTIAIINKFTGNGLDIASLYHLKYGLQGSGASEFSGYIVFWTLVTFFTAALPFAVFRQVKFSHRSPKKVKISLLLILSALIISFLSNGLFYNYLKNRFRQYPQIQFSQAYKTPKTTSINTSQKNLVYLYLESFERTYFDQNHFPGLVQDLQKIEQKATTFTNIHQLDETSWTIAGMVASQCGLPLTPPANGVSMSEIGAILPSATCLGDILKAQRYDLTFIGGAKAEFAGKGNFYTSHSFDQVLDSQYFLDQAAQPPQNDWGVYDQFVLEEAWEIFQQKSQKPQPFALFALTLDTHHPHGLASPICQKWPYQDGKNTMLNAIHCSDKLASQFINNILTSPYAKDTIIVIASDHLAMPNEAYKTLERLEPSRRNLFMIIDPDSPSPASISTPGTTLDAGATVISLLSSQQSLGLGRNLFQNQPFISEIDKISYYLWYWTDDIREFWY